MKRRRHQFQADHLQKELTTKLTQFTGKLLVSSLDNCDWTMQRRGKQAIDEDVEQDPNSIHVCTIQTSALTPSEQMVNYNQIGRESASTYKESDFIAGKVREEIEADETAFHTVMFKAMLPRAIVFIIDASSEPPSNPMTAAAGGPPSGRYFSGGSDHHQHRNARRCPRRAERDQSGRRRRDGGHLNRGHSNRGHSYHGHSNRGHFSLTRHV